MSLWQMQVQSDVALTDYSRSADASPARCLVQVVVAVDRCKPSADYSCREVDRCPSPVQMSQPIAVNRCKPSADYSCRECGGLLDVDCMGRLCRRRGSAGVVCLTDFAQPRLCGNAGRVGMVATGNPCSCRCRSISWSGATLVLPLTWRLRRRWHLSLTPMQRSPCLPLRTSSCDFAQTSGAKLSHRLEY